MRMHELPERPSRGQHPTSTVSPEYNFANRTFQQHPARQQLPSARVQHLLPPRPPASTVSPEHNFATHTLQQHPTRQQSAPTRQQSAPAREQLAPARQQLAPARQQLPTVRVQHALPPSPPKPALLPPSPTVSSMHHGEGERVLSAQDSLRCKLMSAKHCQLLIVPSTRYAPNSLTTATSTTTGADEHEPPRLAS
jgi:hypothetical protein